ncbi:Tetratricopeptide repeat protein 36-like protein [Zancudomyces culisetae]|uniref:Tetratricopeptide repeat protein 36-like protein n=1 Tax=Zancudomyces culisetae TaxID=1213189 RepID=A0A1R1PQ74_ZANCU|nr:Tetratricopeptide repeat protein 36-like protein [Zancudomyces culisetae]|eukprot:OMH83135.1 Tetratricopeptide repeat protein 36-like protein [Zancudomyces culisetae]
MNSALSERDSKIIEAIMGGGGIEEEFTREQLLGTVGDSNHAHAEIEPEKDSFGIDQESLTLIKSDEKRAVLLAEGGDLDAALEILSQIIAKYPKYPSAYNNRAQVYRLLGKNDLALSDLDTTIELGNCDSTLLGQAYTQRGIIKRALGDDECALANFEVGAECGNEVAKMAQVRENPYAKMCNAMFLNALAELTKPKDDVEE